MKCMMVVCGKTRLHFDETMDEARVFFRSFQAVNKSRPKFILHTTKEYISEVMKLEEEYPWMEWTVIDTVRYEKAGKNDPRYYKLEAYDISDDNVFVFDADFIWLKSIDQLFSWSAPIAMCRETQRDCFNSGLVAINKSKLESDIYWRLLKHPHDGGYGNDQNILNSYFKGKIHKLDQEWNRLILSVESIENVCGLHMILKPWWDNHRGRVSPEITEQVKKIYNEYGGQY